MTKKYELTEETMALDDGTILHRIKALVDIDIRGRKVKAGDLGGWIEKESNLSHEGKCWAFDETKVYGDAMIYGDASIYGDAEVYGDAEIHSNNKKSDETPFDLYKLIDDCISKKDRYVYIYVGEAGMSVSVYPLSDEESED